RSASEDVAAIVGMGKAAEIAERRMGSDGKRLTRMRDKIMDSVSETVEGVSVYGHREHRLPNNAMIGIFGVEGEQAIMELDKNGISASTGSACASKNLDLSHVLEAIGVNEVERYGTILFSLSRWNREKEVDRLLAVLPRIIGELREISPIWKFRDRLEEFYAG
ncbi:MAG: aminotransferase class V-fold PLP-dependent enzyme, partial [Nitrososphaerales archaeon]